MGIKFEALVTLEYDLRDDMTIEELAVEVLDQIRNGEYFASRVKDVQLTPINEAS